MTAMGGDESTLQPPETLKTCLKRYGKVAREILYGLTIHEVDMALRKDRSHLNNLFMLAVFGDLIGLPVLPPYYSLRLYPHIIPMINSWRRHILRERDLTDLGSFDL